MDVWLYILCQFMANRSENSRENSKRSNSPWMTLVESQRLYVETEFDQEGIIAPVVANSWAKVAYD